MGHCNAAAFTVVKLANVIQRGPPSGTAYQSQRQRTTCVSEAKLARAHANKVQLVRPSIEAYG